MAGTGLQLADAARIVKTLALTTTTHCPYCALQCGMHVVQDGGLKIIGNPKFPVNEGGLCIKGWSAAATLNHADRLLTPLVRDGNGSLVPASFGVCRFPSRIFRTRM
jgi:anaerobic selenocysteine-containing dehydrogenase